MDESRSATLTPLVSPSANPVLHASRPGRAVRVHSINTIQAVCTPNDYVDPYTISSISNNSPDSVRSENRFTNCKHKYDKLKPCRSSTEQSDNLSNERRERVKHKYEQQEVSEKPPALPPRAAPPLPPRIRRNSCSRVETLPRRITSPALLPTPNSIRRSKSLTRQNASMVDRCVPCSTSSRCLPQHGRRCPPPQPAILISTESSHTMLLEFRVDKSRIIKKPSCADNQRGQPMTVSTDQSGSKTTNSIICPECGQCRCKSCKGRCSCTVERVVDTLSCMCCIRTCVNECTCEEGEDRYAASSNVSVDPCSCAGTPSRCCLRWTLLTALTLCIPCLLLYWPLKVVGQAATVCHSRGCNCDRTS